MAHNIESGRHVVSSAPDPSPSDLLGETKIHPRLVKIPSAQKELLGKSASWAGYLSQRPNGFLNVPPEALEQLTASYARRKQASASGEAEGTRSDARDEADVPEPIGTQSRILPHVELEDEDDGDGTNEDLAELTSWASTPPGDNNKEPSPRQSFITQLPQNSPPQPTIATSPSGHPNLPSSSHSSQGPDDELEVEIPAALAHQSQPTNKSALPVLATPPSAQVVPCTFEQPARSAPTTTSRKLDAEPRPQSRTHRYNRVPELYRGPKRGPLSSHLHTITDMTKLVAASNQNDDLESSLSTENTPSSIIPSTRTDQDIEGKKHTTVWDVRPDLLSTYGPDPSSNPHLGSLTSRYHSPAHMPTQLSHLPPSPQPPSLLHFSGAPPAVATKSWETPFAHYTVTYPDYTGTIRDFVIACVYIQLYQQRIRTSLYDDFIRAWVDGFVPYVQNCDKSQPPQKPLKAIQWYNEIDDDPVFTLRVVTRQNLQEILNFYPKEVEMARPCAGISSSQGATLRSVSGSHAEPYYAISLSYPTDTDQSKDKEPMRKSVQLAGAAAKVSEASPTLKPRIPAPTPNQHIPPAHPSLREMNTQPIQRRDSTQSLSEATTRKRVATSDLRSKGRKRITIDLTPEPNSRIRPDSSGTVRDYSERPEHTARSSATPALSSRQSAKADQDPDERRRRRLEKHFKKQLARREGFTSPAPVNTTPMSGQEQ